MTADEMPSAPGSPLGELVSGAVLSPPLPTLLGSAEAATWLRASLTTFGRTVASVLPGQFAAYARVYHPFDSGGAPSIASTTWRELAKIAKRTLRTPADAADFAMKGVPGTQAPTGTLPRPLIDLLVTHLRPATTAPEACTFAVWEGFGDCVVPRWIAPTLELPHRKYHLFAGSLPAARTSYSSIACSHQSANLWWPADRAWCVATEIDFAWTYVGGPRSCVDAILADPLLETVETSAFDRW